VALTSSMPLCEDPGKRLPLKVATGLSTDDSLVLTLVLDDPELILDLRTRDEGASRTAFAMTALKIGVLSLRQTQRSVDAEALKNEGQHIISDLNRELQFRIAEIDGKIASNLKQYFDPQSGKFTERVERLIRKDGDLERVLRQQIGDAENSELARTLANRVGANSPLMRRLDPDDAESITQAIEESVRDVLDSEQKSILFEFSLDNESGALTRLIGQLEEVNGKFRGDIDDQIKGAVREFSLDDENSALSRLVRRVEQAKAQITDEFSIDNEHSAINKLNLVLAETKRSIHDNLTLDDEQSSLARLNKQLTAVLEDIRTKNQRFQEDVSAKLASLLTKHQEEQRSTIHGVSFEAEFCALVQREAQRAGDIFTATGAIPGFIPRCKAGDATIELGAEASAAGEKIVLEAKGNKSCTLADARAEIEVARKNRAASVGVFVFKKGSAPGGLQTFTRVDHDVFIIWDAADSSTDIYLLGAISVAKALLFRQWLAENKSSGDLQSIERAVNILEKQFKSLDEMETWTTTVRSNSGKILKGISKIREAVDEQIQNLRASIEALKTIGG
jgi:hypothetical protein